MGNPLDSDSTENAVSAVYPRFGRESLCGRDLAQKGIAAVLVALGVALVSH
jgi:hypothetical protein